jgi:glycerate 2-kinase
MSEPHDGGADAAAIRAAAVAAVQPQALVVRRLMIRAGELLLDGRALVPLGDTGRIVVVGGGKAAAGMAAAVERLLLTAGIAPARLAGLVSVPAGCGLSLERIEVRETRPAGRNMPTPAAEAATREMLALVAGLTPADLAIVVVTGGGSALVAAPRAGVPLAEKVAAATFLAAAGADIRALNTVRQAASDVKAGGLARACGAGRLLALVLSDVIGDSLDMIASGPCMPVVPRPAAAVAVLERFGAIDAGVAPRLVERLRADACGLPPAAHTGSSWMTPRGCRVDHVLLGSNATAVEAAAAAARQAGYDVVVRHADPSSAETADEVGRRLAAEGLALAERAARAGRGLAVIEGGEAVVKLPADHGRGGRNQQTAVAALAAVRARGHAWPRGLCIASLGTDGEDGPTTAAGGLVDAAVVAAIDRAGLDVEQAMARCDAYPLLARAGGLIVTGPTGTNVADVRLVLARP